MKQEIHVVGLGGSLASHSTSLAALAIAMDAAAGSGARVETFGVRELDLPIFDPEIADAPSEAVRFAEAVYEAQGLLWSSPLYHGTVSGSFKNVLDWLQLLARREPPYLTNKVVGLISVAGGVQGLQAVNTMEFVVRALRGWAVPLVIPIPQAWRAFDEHGRAREPQTEAQLRKLGQEVVRAARQFAEAGTCDYAEVGSGAGIVDRVGGAGAEDAAAENGGRRVR